MVLDVDKLVQPIPRKTESLPEIRAEMLEAPLSVSEGACQKDTQRKTTAHSEGLDKPIKLIKALLSR